MDRLTTWALVYTAGLILHTADHLRRGTDATTQHVFWAGMLSTAMGLAAVALVLNRHRLAPLAAAATGIPIGVGVSAVHFLPKWGVFSDPLIATTATGVSGWSS